MSRLRLVTAGESHGPGLSAILSGMPAGLTIDFELLTRELKRRQHGYGRGPRMKIESDRVEFRGGVRGGTTLGSPISMWIENRDYRNWDRVMNPIENDPGPVEKRRLYSPRPGHADLAGGLKYLSSDLRNVLERASARESAARVAAGAIAKALLAHFDIEIRSGVRSLGPLGAHRATPSWQDLLAIDDGSPLRAIDRDLEPEMVALIDSAKQDGDTLGGSFTVIAHNVPAGLGSHVQWDEKLDGRLARAVMSVPAVKAVEIGAAVDASTRPGSGAHDHIEWNDASGWTRPSNHAGGLEGGITNGEDVVVTGYKKPISTLLKGLPSVDIDSRQPHRSQYERSDVTALPAAGVIAESMVALVLADALLSKIGGDSMREVEAHWRATSSQQQAWPETP
ncbi:MAG: chorismate synthase [Acidimicrobiia bacterium]|nr:chorismate synthase [Acidimicrobiia bacterium]